MTGRLRITTFTLAGLLATSGSLSQAQVSIDQAVKESQYPAPINTFEIELGHKTDYRDGGKNETYRRITYKGSLVRADGTPFKYATGLDLAAPATGAGAGDRNALSFRYEDATASVGGGLFEAMGVAPFALRAPEGLELRGSAFAGGDADGKNLQLAVGVETPPFRLPGLRESRWSNWIVFGLNAQRQDRTDSSTGDTTFGLITYRAFLGKAFGWRRVGDAVASARRIADEIMKKAPTLESGRQIAAAIQKNTKVPERTAVQKLIVDAAQEASNDAQWEATVRSLVAGHEQAAAEQPTYAIYAEDSGWYSSGKAFDGKRLRNLFTLTLDYWFMPQRDDIFFRARYENGYERATPDERKNHLLLSVGLKF